MELKREKMLALLAEMLACHGPIGDEREIDAVVLREFRASGARTWQDGMSNIYAHVPGEGPRVMVAAHKDELGLIISQIEDDGRLRVKRLGGPYPWKYGEGPIDVIADNGGVVSAILSFGSTHTRSGPMGEFRRGERTPTWDDVTLFTGLEPAELSQLGVHVGSRAVIARSRKRLKALPGDHIGSFALDDRMGLTGLVFALRHLVQRPVAADLYLVATTAEETGYLGARRAAHLLRPDIVLALDTAPVTPDTPTTLDARPVVWYDEASPNSLGDCNALVRLADELGFGAQPVVYESAGSDAGGVRRIGLAERTAALGFPRLNSHGYEIARADVLVNGTELLLAWLRQL
ncbi:MAG: hypothetical protein OXF32_08880 [Anaerolineaceae bacterium]|nr:hypothetical protein [Anaerolineaceae bacterium]